MQLTILGSGTLFPRLKRNAPGYLVKIDKDLVLMDAGEGSKKRLMEAGVDPIDVDQVLITHTHVDHIAELPALFWYFNYPETPRKKDLIVIGPKGFKKYIQEMLKLFMKKSLKEYEKGVGFKLKIREVSKSRIKFKSWVLKTDNVDKQKHTYLSDAIAFRLEQKDKSMVYGGDTRYNYPKNLLNLAKDTDLLLVESAKPDQHKSDEHLTPSKAGELATKANAKKLVLTHFYPDCEKYDIKKQAQKEYKGPIVIAKDLMKIKI